VSGSGISNKSNKYVQPQTHTHTRLMALFQGLSGWAGTRKVKPIWVLLKQELQWHQLGHMQVCTSLQTDNHTSTQPLKFFTGWMPFLPPNQQCQSTEGKIQPQNKTKYNISLSQNHATV